MVAVKRKLYQLPGSDKEEGSLVVKRSRFYKPGKVVTNRNKAKHCYDTSLVSAGLSPTEIEALRALASQEVNDLRKKLRRPTGWNVGFRKQSPRVAALSNGAIVSFGLGVAAASAAPSLPVVALGAALIGGVLGYRLTDDIPDE